MSGTLISIYSSKGGSGKTFIAVNLAVDLRLETRQRVLLVDTGYPFSVDIPRQLELKPLKTIDKILPLAGQLNPAVFQSYTMGHASGIDVLSITGDGNIEPLDLLNISVVLNKLSQEYDFVIVDIGMMFCPAVEAILDASAQIFIPVIPDQLSLEHARRDISFLKSKNFSQKVIKVVLNMEGKQPRISKKIVEKAIHGVIDFFIPYDREALEHQSSGPYPSEFPTHEVTQAVDSLVYQILSKNTEKSMDPGRTNDNESIESFPDIGKIKQLIHQKLFEFMDLKQVDIEVENSPEKQKELQLKISEKVMEIIDSETSITSRTQRNRILKESLQEILGLGPLEDLLDQSDVSEIMVNHWDRIYVEKAGKIELTSSAFTSEKHLQTIIGRIVAPLGRKIDNSTPMVDARLQDGSRVNAVIPPLSINGATVTIRKFPETSMTIDALIKRGTLNKQIADFLSAVVKAKLNVLISGGTGSGKTTLLNIISGFISPDERIITIEDSAELKLQQSHVITLESRPSNIEGTGEISIRDLVKNSLRMRPDRIVVGECRGAEALDMLQAMNTGHDGSLTTIHANSCREALSRLETLVTFTGIDLPSKAIKDQIKGAIDIVVQIKRLRDGSRKIQKISEVTGMEGDVLTMGDIFVFNQSGEKDGRVTGNFISTGYVPKCLEKIKNAGISIPKEIFWANQ